MPAPAHFHARGIAAISGHYLSTGEPHPSRPVLFSIFRFLYLVVMALIFLCVLVKMANAGGPRYIAGASFFDPGSKGVPLTWTAGAISYYTDQGDLSPILPQASADAFVADAFNHWTSVSTAAISATRAGQLAEDVSGSNVIVNGNGTITMPADISPSAVNTPVGIVYDADGKVTDALLGQGSGDSFYCFTNAVYGGPDNFSSDAHLAHALVIINGNCAQGTAQLPDVTYRLVRVLGSVLGMDWSQVNINVLTYKPPPGSDDYDGFPVMHAIDNINCVPMSKCYANADQVKMDDRAALSRLYPVTAENQGNFPGKQVFSDTTVRIYGSVQFADATEQAAQPMQGVNVVARWIDPITGARSRKYAAASVSGFLFRGYAGNPVNGYLDGAGQRFDRYGTDDTSLEGFFDLAGLEIPDGSDSVQYELTVEALDPLWSTPVGPYGPWQVQPSGTAAPIVVTIQKGGSMKQDVVLLGGSTEVKDSREPDTYSAPTPVPLSASWVGSLSGYGDADYVQFFAQANRTLSVEVTALDESSAITESKALPVIGMWQLSDPEGTPAPAYTPFAFNTDTFGVTRLNAQILQATDFRAGISDYRGDGRPDYRYAARIFYGDAIVPARASTAGGTPLAVEGMGFLPGNTVAVGGTGTSVLSTDATQMLFKAPAATDGVQSITLSDPTTGASSVMTDALTYGAGPTDILRLLLGSNPATPVGGEAPNPIVVQVVDATSTAPIAGASVAWSVSPAASFSACGGASSCTVTSDDMGEVFTRVTVLSAGTMTISATLAPNSYPKPKVVQTTLQGISSPLDIALTSPYQSLAQGITIDLPLTARVLGTGIPLSGKTVEFTIEDGNATLSYSSVNTDGNGYANNTVHIKAMSGEVDVSACAQSGNKPCQTFYLTAVPPSSLALQMVGGDLQMIPVGQRFGAVTVRVIDSGAVYAPVRGVGVVFQSNVFRPVNDAPVRPSGEIIITHPHSPVILSSSQIIVTSDVNGLASAVPSAGPIGGAVQIEGSISAGSSTPLAFEAFSLWPDNAGNFRKFSPPGLYLRKRASSGKRPAGAGSSQATRQSPIFLRRDLQ